VDVAELYDSGERLRFEDSGEDLRFDNRNYT